MFAFTEVTDYAKKKGNVVKGLGVIVQCALKFSVCSKIALLAVLYFYTCMCGWDAVVYGYVLGA